MNIETFIKQFKDLLEEPDAVQITASTLFRDLDEYSSLLALTIVAMVDEEYDVAIKAEDLRKAQTIEDLFNIIKEKKA
jgi:acyl carrier protein